MDDVFWGCRKTPSRIGFKQHPNWKMQVLMYFDINTLNMQVNIPEISEHYGITH